MFNVEEDHGEQDSSTPVEFGHFNFLGIDDPSSTCMVCLVELEEGTRTREHVYPDWLQNHLGIVDKYLTLPDGRLEKYSQLTVPLCARCNNEDLGGLENEMRELFVSGTGARGFASTGKLYLWLFKLYAFNQIFSLSEPGWSFDPDGTASNGLDPDLVNVALRRLSQVRASQSVAAAESPHGSLLISRVTEEVASSHGPFDWYDNPALGAAMLRVNGVVFHVCFEDNGAVAAEMLASSSYKNPLEAAMTLPQHLDYSAAFFAHTMSVRRPTFLFLGRTDVVPAGLVRWAPQDSDTWHASWVGFERLWSRARGYTVENSED